MGGAEDRGDGAGAPPGGDADEHLRGHGQRRQRDQAGIDGQLPPGLREAWRQLNASGRSGLDATGDAVRALRSLLVADVALARSAAGRALVFGSLAIVFGGSAWLLLMASLMVFLSRSVGIDWWVALVATALVSLMIAALAGWMAMRYFDHTRMQATRRQLARLGIGELASRTPSPGSPESAREAAARQRRADAPPGDGHGADATPS